MPKQNQHTEAQINKILNFTEHLRSKLVIPSIELENFLNFQYSQILKKNLFNICTIQKTSINKSFKRAFKTLSTIQQVNYYSKCVKMVLKQMHSTNEKIDESSNLEEETNTDNHRNTKKFNQFSILLKQEGHFKKWIIYTIQLAAQISVLRLVQTGQQLDLHHYILRESNSKEKPALVLEATDEMTHPITLRLTNYQQSFENLKNKLQFYFDKALKDKVVTLLRKNRASFTSLRSSIQGDFYVHQKQMKSQSFKNKNQLNQYKPATMLLAEGKHTKSMRKIILQSSKRSFPEHQYRKIYLNLTSKEKIFSLSSFKDFQQVSEDVYFNKKSQVTRRIFRFDESKVSYQWLVTSMNCYKMFKKWKSCLFLINLLAQFPQERTKIYHEINLYKDYNEVDYVFLRHLFEIDGVNYYIDKSINTEEYGRVSNGSRGWIEECIWRFRKTGSTIQLLVQIQFGECLNKKNLFQLAMQYIGQVSVLKNIYSQDISLKSSTLKTIYNHNLFLFEDQSEFNGKQSQIGSPTKRMQQKSKKQPKNQLSNYQQTQTDNLKIHNKADLMQNVIFPSFLDQQNLETKKSQAQREDFNHPQTQFYSIQDSRISSQDDIRSNDNENYYEQVNFGISEENIEQKNGQNSGKHNELQVNQSLNYFSTQKQENQATNLQKYPQSARYLYASHPVNCRHKDIRNKPKKTTEQNGHYIWKKQWKVTDKGELININQQQIKVQSSVLKLVAKRMGRNLLAGKSVLNISLPIQIFGTDSNLQRLCKSMAYGPIFLQAAAKMQSPVQRMKRVICFALGFSICYIEMQKPFNPILGETFQGIIDGCPVYGQQISHHPPISTVLFKGRGYTVYGNLEAKVDMGLNTASGINDGNINVAFSENNFYQNVIRFTSPPGELSGLVIGERKLTLTKKTYYLDEKNMILGVIHWGAQKKNNQISFNNDYFDGQIVKLKPNTDLTKLDKIKEAQFQNICSEIKGRWTNKVWFDNAVLFDVQTDGPYLVQQQPYSLESSVHYREDIILRKKNDLVLAQQAKQRLQQIQRNDRKLRNKYVKHQ